ncbi:hypothetical protein WJR50_00090 [Catalinimonas sp. 4WD22]|uniref:hypothetical protein n=1 Tax=Catalinimonas locisalis TaxID=3133978 RepID=UPI0031013F27
MIKKLSNYPLYAKSIIFFYTAGYLVMMFYHIDEVLQLGFSSRDIPSIINIWYDALGFFIVPLTIILLYVRPHVGLTFSLSVMMLTFIFDALIRYIILEGQYANWFYYFEMVFAILVLTSFPIMRFLVKPKKSDKHLA